MISQTIYIVNLFYAYFYVFFIFLCINPYIFAYFPYIFILCTFYIFNCLKQTKKAPFRTPFSEWF